MSTIIQQIPDYIEFNGRIETSLEYFEDMNMDDNLIAKMNKKYDKAELSFEKIDFEKVSFRYSSELPLVMENFNMNILTTKNKIIGITGLSGKGKSTFMKLIIKMYKPSNGVIKIDGVDIQDIDTTYLRQNITYVNQNSKMFDKNILNNILYGCTETDACHGHLKEILKYDKIKELYKNIDLYGDEYKSANERLSGGQRQIINIIGGLVNPSKILILDEPTNGLDPELKQELLSLIKDFKSYKTCIMIITHDRDVYPLFTEEIKI
jgi:ABC-type bacteriocin/lantibiotic exporter with double-glycine peptidase domain